MATNHKEIVMLSNFVDRQRELRLSATLKQAVIAAIAYELEELAAAGVVDLETGVVTWPKDNRP